MARPYFTPHAWINAISVSYSVLWDSVNRPYNPSTHEVTPVENRTIVLKRAGGGYAKIEIMDYYKQEFTDDGPRPVPRFYSLRFDLSDSGSW